MQAKQDATAAIEVVEVNPDGIPDYLTKRPQWVVWCLEFRDGEPTKVLYNAQTGRRASHSELLTWSTFEQAYSAYTSSDDWHGVGFVFCSGDPFVGIDLDKCRDPLSGEVKPWARGVLDRFPNAYREVSPSSRGVHIITRGQVPRESGNRKGSIEIYDQKRFFTITGVQV